MLKTIDCKQPCIWNINIANLLDTKHDHEYPESRNWANMPNRLIEDNNDVANLFISQSSFDGFKIILFNIKMMG